MSEWFSEYGYLVAVFFVVLVVFVVVLNKAAKAYMPNPSKSGINTENMYCF